MSNTIKYSESTEQRALNKGNWWIGTGDINKGPSNVTGFYAGVTPPSSGYTIYTKREDNLPSIFVAQNDQELIFLTNQISESNFTTTQECLNYFQDQDDKLCMNREYENIVTDGLVLNLDAGHVSSYPTTNTTFYDLSGNDNNGNLINGTIFSGGSMVFDGADDYVNFGNIINSPSAITINFWVKNPNNKVIITKGYRVWEIRFSGNKFGGYVGVSEGSNWYGIADRNDILHGADLTKWNNFTYIFDYSNKIMKFYTNSVEKGSVTVETMISTYTPTYNLNIGRRVEFNNAYFSGSLSNVYIYDRSLSATEILQNYNALKGRFGL